MPPPLKRHPLKQSKLFNVKTRAKLAMIFGLTEDTLQQIAAMDPPYSQRQLELLRNGKTKVRDIQEPRGALRPIYERVQTLLSRIEPPDFLFCPVKRRSYVSNAARHAGARHVRTLDLKAYFPSTPQHRVFWFFRKVMQCEPDVSAILAKLLTINGCLATGSTVSPILSFFAFYDMWHSIAEKVESHGCKLSVYIDDITISGDNVCDLLIWEVQKEICSRGLRYHKERDFRRGTAEITGVLVKGGKLSIPNRQHLKAHLLREELKRGTNADQSLATSKSLLGLRSQREQIEGHIF